MILMISACFSNFEIHDSFNPRSKLSLSTERLVSARSGAANFENRAIFEVSCHVISNMPIFEFTWPISDFTWLKNHVISNIAYFRIYMASWAMYIRIYMAGAPYIFEFIWPNKPCNIEYFLVFFVANQYPVIEYTWPYSTIGGWFPDIHGHSRL